MARNLLDGLFSEAQFETDKASIKKCILFIMRFALMTQLLITYSMRLSYVRFLMTSVVGGLSLEYRFIMNI